MPPRVGCRVDGVSVCPLIWDGPRVGAALGSVVDSTVVGEDVKPLLPVEGLSVRVVGLTVGRADGKVVGGRVKPIVGVTKGLEEGDEVSPWGSVKGPVGELDDTGGTVVCNWEGSFVGDSTGTNVGEIVVTLVRIGERVGACDGERFVGMRDGVTVGSKVVCVDGPVVGVTP